MRWRRRHWEYAAGCRANNRLSKYGCCVYFHGNLQKFPANWWIWKSFTPPTRIAPRIFTLNNHASTRRSFFFPLFPSYMCFLCGRSILYLGWRASKSNFDNCHIAWQHLCIYQPFHWHLEAPPIDTSSAASKYQQARLRTAYIEKYKSFPPLLHHWNIFTFLFYMMRCHTYLVIIYWVTRSVASIYRDHHQYVLHGESEALRLPSLMDIVIDCNLKGCQV